MGKGDIPIQTTKPTKKVDTLEEPKVEKKEDNEVIEDDEFEEFEDNIACDDADNSKEQWEDDWDTEQIDDDFSKQLRQEIESHQ